MFADKQSTVYKLFAPAFIPGCNASMQPVACSLQSVVNYCNVLLYSSVMPYYFPYFSMSQIEFKDQTVCVRTTAPTDERLELGEQTVYSRSGAPDETRLSLPLQQNLAKSTQFGKCDAHCVAC